MLGLEPSCVSIFRDEMVNLLHGNHDAERLRRQTFTLAEFLSGQASAPAPSKLQAGLDVEVVDSGCCGMAGAFGHEKEHHDVGLKCGERALLPAVRNTGPDTMIVADGFSCREMILQETERRPLHLAQVLAQCGLPPAEPLRRRSIGASYLLAAGALALGLLGGLGVGSLWRRSR